jgi:hypothetical protein
MSSPETVAKFIVIFVPYHSIVLHSQYKIHIDSALLDPKHTVIKNKFFLNTFYKLFLTFKDHIGVAFD